MSETERKDSEEGGYFGDDEVKVCRSCDQMMQHGIHSQLCSMLFASRELPGLHVAGCGPAAVQLATQ